MRFFITVCLVYMMLVGIVSQSVWAQAQAPKRSETSARAVVGGVFSPEAYRGKSAVLLFFWTTWCPYCREELKGLKDQQAALTTAGVELAIINVGESVGQVSRFVEKLGLSSPVYLDEDQSLADQYRVMGVPTFILIGKDGTELTRDNAFPLDYKKRIVS